MNTRTIIARALYADTHGGCSGPELEALSETLALSGADAALEALDAAGLVIVPKEATDEMKTAGRTSFRDGGLLPSYTDEGRGGQPPILHYLLGPAWAAMVAAVPNHEQTPQESPKPAG